jgi:pyruvate,water dikinase
MFGGKAVSLGAALRAGLPVPPGVGVAAPLVDAVAAGNEAAISAVIASAHVPEGRVAVRSSAVGEDSAGSSFAGQHATKLNVMRAQLVAAIREVWESGRAEAALAYRRRKGIDTPPAVGVVIQTLVESHAAGVLFTRNPVTGANERVIEAAWGLGEVVVSGRIVPDYYRLSADGRLLEQVAGDKDVRIERDENGGTVDVIVSESLRRLSCLHPGRLERLHALAQQCQAVWSHELDLEFAFTHDDTLFLLQSRPITVVRGPAA